MMGHIPLPQSHPMIRQAHEEFSEDEDKEPLPSEFSWAESRPECISPIQDQGSCGSCYAFSSAAMLAERHCITQNLDSAQLLSTEFIISCDALDFGCQGGHLGNTIDFLTSYIGFGC